MDLLYELQLLLPKAIDWAHQHHDTIQQHGKNLTTEQLLIAEKVGVTTCDKVKLLEVDKIPIPDDDKLKQAAKQIGFLNDDMQGLTLEHSIYVKKGSMTTRLLSHELRHVYQYEAFGSIPEFLVEYLKQIVLVGYENALLEQDARQHEIDD